MQIESEFICVKTDPKGACLMELVDLENGQNAISRPKPLRGPHFFPIVGHLKDERYRLGSKYFTVPTNGLALDASFEVVQAKKDEITYRLGYSGETLKYYPYKFLFEVTYRVYGPKLFVEYRVFNVDKKEIYFSLGFGPHFKMAEGLKLEDYYIEFEERESTGAYYLNHGLVNFEEKDDKTIFDGRRIELKSDLFSSQGIIFKDLVSNRIALKNKRDAREVILDFSNTPYLAVTYHKETSSISLCPSYGVTDVTLSDHDFFKKEGIYELEKGESFETSFSIQVN